MSGTFIPQQVAYGPTDIPPTATRLQTTPPARGVRYCPLSPYAVLRDVRDWPSVCFYRPTPCYAMSGTDLAYGATSLRDSRTDLAYGAATCYAMGGTDLLYGATAGAATGLRLSRDGIQVCTLVPYAISVPHIA
eukprot:1879891-Rhodomonas_salina.2